MKEVVILGSPNVGKSTLFNRIIGKRQAITEDTPGVTRDRNLSEVEWNNKRFKIVDTGGFDLQTKETLEQQILKQIYLAIDKADILLGVLDCKRELIPSDYDMVHLIRTSQKPHLFVANKFDHPSMISSVGELYRLGIDKFYFVSALHGFGIRELLDAISEKILKQDSESKTELYPYIAVVGRPNVGKSSLVNKILGQERMIVHESPGTTRDAIDTLIETKQGKFFLIDTAGIRRKSKIDQSIERYGVKRAIDSIKKAEVTLCLLDGKEGITEQDIKILSLSLKYGAATLAVLNKCDLIDAETIAQEKIRFQRDLPQLAHLPFIPISAKTGKGIKRLFKYIFSLYEKRKERIKTSELNLFFHHLVSKIPHPRHQGKEVKFYYITQVSSEPPKFVIVTSHPQNISASYQRFILNKIRLEFGFKGIPIIISYQGRKERRNPKWI
jgi:GTP-binding protein